MLRITAISVCYAVFAADFIAIIRCIIEYLRTAIKIGCCEIISLN